MATTTTNTNGRNYWGNLALTILCLAGTLGGCFAHEIPWSAWGIAMAVACGWVPLALVQSIVRDHTRAMLAMPPALPPLPVFRGPGGGGAGADTTGRRRADEVSLPRPAAPESIAPAVEPRSSLPGVGFAGFVEMVRGLSAGPRFALSALALVVFAMGSQGCAAGASGGAASGSGSTSNMIRAAVRWACAAAPVVESLVDGAGNLAASEPTPGRESVLLVGPAPASSGGDALGAVAIVLSRPVARTSTTRSTATSSESPSEGGPPPVVDPSPRTIGPRATSTQDRPR